MHRVIMLIISQVIIMIDPLHNPVTLVQISAILGRDIQNKGTSKYNGESCLALNVPLYNLWSSMVYFVPGDQMMQSVYQSVNLHNVRGQLNRLAKQSLDIEFH